MTETMQAHTTEDLMLAATRVITQIQRTASLSPEERAAKVRKTFDAVEKLVLGAPWEPVPDNDQAFAFQSESERDAGTWHHTDAEGCDCKAAKQDRLCWHKPARVLLWLLVQDAPRSVNWDTAPAEPTRFWAVCTDGTDGCAPELLTEAEFEERNEEAEKYTDGTWYYIKITAEQASLLTQEPEPEVAELPFEEAPAPAQAEPERQAARPYPRLYVCPNDHGTMIETVAPGGDPIVECQSCGKSVDQAQAGALEPLPASEARGVARAYGRAA